MLCVCNIGLSIVGWNEKGKYVNTMYMKLNVNHWRGVALSL